VKSIFSIVVLIPFFILGCKNSPTQATTTSLPTQGLLAYYPFNGNANDSSGNVNNGVIYGVTLTTDRFGYSNSAYLFNGSASIAIPELFEDSCSAFTFTAWVRKNTIDNSTHMIIYKGLKKGEAALVINPGALGFWVNLHIPGKPSGEQNWYSATVTDTLKIDTYYFLVGRYIKGQKIDLLINGIQISSVVVPNLNLVSDTARTSSAIGIHTEPSFTTWTGWNGVIDDVRVFDRALSDQEILILFRERGWLGK